MCQEVIILCSITHARKTTLFTPCKPCSTSCWFSYLKFSLILSGSIILMILSVILSSPSWISACDTPGRKTPCWAEGVLHSVRDGVAPSLPSPRSIANRPIRIPMINPATKAMAATKAKCFLVLSLLNLISSCSGSIPAPWDTCIC